MKRAQAFLFDYLLPKGSYARAVYMFMLRRWSLQ